METLKLNARLRTAEPEVLLDPTLPVGRYVVSLVVTGEQGDSTAATVQITVQRAIVRPPVIEPVLPTPVRPVPVIPVVGPGVVTPVVVTPVAGPTPVRDLKPPRAPERKPGPKRPRRKKEE